MRNGGAGDLPAAAPKLRTKTPVGTIVKRATCDEIYPGYCACLASVEDDECAQGACDYCQSVGHHGPIRPVQ